MEQPEGSYAQPGDDGQEEQDGEEGSQEDKDDGALGHLDIASADAVLDVESREGDKGQGEQRQDDSHDEEPDREERVAGTGVQVEEPQGDTG